MPFAVPRRALGALPFAVLVDSPPPALADDQVPANIDDTLGPYLARFGLPALAAAVVLNGQIVAIGAVGARRAGTDTPVTPDDRFHIGSDTKAMTALLAAMLIEQGKARWDMTVGEALPDLAPGMDPGFRAITLEQLLSHTSGIPGDSDDTTKLLLASYGRENENLDDTRRWLVSRIGKQAPRTKPGTAFAYANMGYVTAGAMLERIAGTTWEEMVVTRIFGPLELDSAGFGPQASLGRVDAPLGHVLLPDGTLKPMLAGPQGDNPLVLGPAGTVHLSVRDFATWAGWNAGEGRRGPALVPADALKKMHTPVIEMIRPDAAPGTPPSGSYGLGWGAVTLPMSKEPFVFHGGSNEMNLAYIMMQPKYDFAMVLVTNLGGAKADDALRGAAAELYGRFGPAR